MELPICDKLRGRLIRADGEEAAALIELLVGALQSAKEELEEYEDAATGEGYNSPQINAALARARGES